MNKTELVKQIATQAQISQVEAKAALEATLQSIKDALIAGDAVQLIGFGTFAVKDCPERTCRNPRSGEQIVVPAHKAVKFKAGNGLI